MIMAADSNNSFFQFPPSFYGQQHVVSFQSGAMTSTTSSAANGMMNPGMVVAGSPGANMVTDQVAGLKHDTGLAVDWSFEEIAILKAGLVKYANEPSIMKYIKIAAMLREKGVRDVALRCRWMSKENGKRRKMEDHYAGKKIKDRKEKMVDSSSSAVIQQVSADSMASYFMMHHANQNNQFSCEVPAIDGITWQLLDDNFRVFSQITSNLSTFKIQDNNDLFCRTRNNITAILNRMSEMPGIMSQMPPLPVSINDDLVNTILPSTSQVTVEEKSYHKSCFKCFHGGCSISLSNYAALEGIVYCKHHFSQLFREKGSFNHLIKCASIRRTAAQVPNL